MRYVRSRGLRPVGHLLLLFVVVSGCRIAPNPPRDDGLALGAPDDGPVARGPGAMPLPLPPANPPDVDSEDAILRTLYESISGDAGEARDWDRFRSLFIEEARLIPVGRADDGEVRWRVMTPEEFVRQVGPRLEETGFHEWEIGRRSERFGNVVHAFSAYEGRRAPDAPEIVTRGINSIQLVHDDARWWVVTILWEAESAGNQLPDRYLEGAPAADLR